MRLGRSRLEIRRNYNRATIAYATLRNYVICKMLDVVATTFKGGNFQTRVVIEMNVHCCDGNIVMVMRAFHETLRQISGGMVVHIN